MDSPAGKIVVLDSYDTVVMANLVKTKLDAYGVPCFLSGEHFTSLYPFRNEIFPGVRLHIFEADLARAREVLAEEGISAKSELYHCPQCKSTKVVFEESNKGYLGRMFFSVLISVIGMLPPQRGKNVYHCQSCDHEFDIAA